MLDKNDETVLVVDEAKVVVLLMLLTAELRVPAKLLLHIELIFLLPAPDRT